MASLFADGSIIDLVLASVLAQAGLLVLLWRRTGRGVPPASLLPMLAAGACLLVGLRLALVGAWWGWIGAAMLAGLVAHLIDLKQRWR